MLAQGLPHSKLALVSLNQGSSYMEIQDCFLKQSLVPDKSGICNIPRRFSLDASTQASIFSVL